MRSNIRRSIVVAAAATGLWALGSVAANAAELPVSSDLPSTGTVTGATQQLPTGDVAGTATKTVKKVAGTAQKTVGGVAGKATGALGGVSTQNLPTGKLPQLGDATGAVDGAKKLLGGADLPKTGQVQKAVDPKKAKKVTKAVKKAVKVAKGAGLGKLSDGTVPSVPSLPATPGVPAANLPGGLPTLPKAPALPKAPGSADNLLAGLAGAGIRPEQLTQQAQAALATARPVVDNAAADALPPVARRIVVKVVPVAQGAAGGAGRLAGDAATQATRS
ncbi:hypothetical protein PQR15_13475 [Streptomyces lydicus]|nr:hypothetical protein [Streptomyces lydicus]